MDYLKERLEQLGYTILRIDSSKLITHDHKADLYYTKGGITGSLMIYKNDTAESVISRSEHGECFL